MRKTIIAAVLAAAVAAAIPQISFAQPAPTPVSAAARSAADVPVKTVVLFSSGVGYFEHAGRVTGDSTTELFFKTNQINDILKSLVLEDRGGGKVTSVVYPSQDPISKLLRSFQVDIANNPSLAELLNQLRGAKVTVAAGAQNLAGTILGVERKTKVVDASKTTVEYWVLNLLTEGTIRSISLDEVTKLDLQDAQLQQELTKALAALASARDQEKKPVTIQFQGQGERQVLVGYVVETPIWKTTYRLLLKSDDNKPRLQGWAIVENQTDNDWNNVQLSLVSGRPISFIQDLYQPLYIPRPVVQPELYASLRPQTYDAGNVARDRVALEAVPAPSAAAPMAAGAGRGGAGGRGGGGGGFGGGGGGMGGMAGGQAADTAGRQAESLGLQQDLMASRLASSSSVASVASAAKMGELFQYTVGSVTLPRQRSAMIPIIADPVEIERLSIYNASVLPKNPLNGVRLKNTTKNHLLQGPVTVIDGAYAGDARIDDVPPTQERLLSYGIDLQVVVNSKRNTTLTSLVSAKIVKGVLQLQRKQVENVVYQIDNKSDQAKTMIIEHPVRNGWKLTQPDKPLETTDTLYRFKVPLGASKAGDFTATEERITGETIQLLSGNLNTLEVYSRTGSEIPANVRAALVKAMQLRQNVADIQRNIDQWTADTTRITQDQSRIRENLKTVPDKSDLQTRYLKTLGDQESQLDQLKAKVDQGQIDKKNAQNELDNYLTNLEIG